MAVKPAGEYNPKKTEEKTLAYWKNDGVMEKTLARSEGRLFSFLEGPPTANAPPALHHVEVRVFKDLVNRFRYMQGCSVPRKAGWDCHGLPVEVQMEKELKLKNKKEVVEYGVASFVEKCRSSVFSHIKEWDRLTERMGYWVDLTAPYVTMENDYIESVWWSIKQIHEKGLLYEGHKVVPFCPRCGTPLSSHEVALGYKSVKEETVIVGFPVKDADYSLLAWTTTPWTLLSNVALAINPKVSYAKIKFRGELFVLAKELAEKRFPEADVVEQLSGQDLMGLEYAPLFNHFIGKLDKPAWKVIAGDFVTTEEGTGIVHIAPAFGEDDYNVGIQNDLPLINPIDEEGKFTDDIPELSGVSAKDADPKIIQILEERGSLVARFPYEHEYPFCWRCSTPLLYYAMKSWFIAMSRVKDKLIENNRKINWFPGHIKEGRFGDWLVNVKDWSLSRNRFWGTPLPIWTCECGNMEVVGSRKELSEKADGNVAEDLDLHRPYVDEVKLKCACGKKMSRVEYVLDCWFDSGSATFAQFHHPFENTKLFEKRFPYDFICEATDQTRGWFYTLLAISTLVFDDLAYKNCVVGGLLLDDAGEKMSASRGNVINPWDLFDSVGADAVRLQMCSQAPWNARRFGEESLKEGVVPFLRTLWSCYEFTTRYMVLDGFSPSEHKLSDCSLEVADKWILSKASQLVSDVTREIEANNYHTVVESITRFVVEDVSRWYIKLIRDRLWLEDEGGTINPKKLSAYMTLSEVFRLACLTLAPIAPFISEEIYSNLVGEGSIHLAEWPKPAKIDEELNTGMEVAKKIFEAASAARQEAKIKLRHPIARVTVTGDETVKKTVETFNSVLKSSLNAHSVEYGHGISGISYLVSPNFKVLGPAYGRDAPKLAEAMKQSSLEVKNAFESGKTIKLGGFEITPDMVESVRVELPDGVKGGNFTIPGVCSGAAYIDAKRDESLMKEALARDLIRNIQELRKKEGLGELDRIKVVVSESEAVKGMLESFRREVLSEVRADEIEFGADVFGASFLFEGEEIKVLIRH